MLLSYRNQSIDLQSKSIDWFLYEGNSGTGISWQIKEVYTTTFLDRRKIRPKKSLYKHKTVFSNHETQLLTIFIPKYYRYQNI